MQYVDANVHLSGDRNHVVQKRDITVVEVAILRALHGEDAVKDIQPRRQGRPRTVELLGYLRHKYRRQMQAQSPDGSRNIVDVMYPGANPNIPTSLADIGIEYAAGGKAKEKPGRAKKSAKQEDENQDQVVVSEDGSGPADSPSE